MPSPASEPDTDEQELLRLQQVIHDHRTTLDAAKTSTPAYQPALAAVLEATVKLVNHKAGIPRRRMETYSARTAVIVKRIGLVTALIIALVAVLTFTPWLSMWWLLLLVPLLIAAGLIAATASGAASSNRPTRRRAAVSWVMTVLVDLTFVIVSHWLPHWLSAVLMGVATLGGSFAAGALLIETAPAKSSETES